MLERFPIAVLKRPWLVVLAVIVIITIGIRQYKEMPVDAFPDVSPVMVSIFCESHGMAPEEIERLITWPIESTMNGLPGVTMVKSTSAFGLAVIYVYFEDSVDIFFARQLVSERLSAAVADLPELEEKPTLGPITTGLGQVFMYYLKADPKVVNTEGKDLNTWLRELNDWVIKYQLQTVKGVTDVLSMGGHVLQYQIRLDPQKLLKYKLTIKDVIEAVNANNRNAGGQFITTDSEEMVVRGIGLLDSIEEMSNIPIKTTDGNPVLLSNIAEIDFGNEIRRGAVVKDEGEEVVSGIVLKLYGTNTSKVISRLNEKIEQIKTNLPKGVELVPYYDQAKLVNNATNTVINAIWQGALLVVAVLLLFIGNWHTTLIIVISLPLCAFIAVIIMNYFGISANLMSLGGIAVAVGMLCDGSIVMMESILSGLKKNKEGSRFKIIASAIKEVANPILFSGIIVIIVFTPLLTLENYEGKMFSPMAFTISAAMVGSILVALLIIPSLSYIFLKVKNDKNEDTFVMRILRCIYRPLRHWTIKHSVFVLIVADICLLSALYALTQVGTEFIPTLEEGSIFVGVNMAPSISLEKATNIVKELSSIAKKHKEVKEVVSRIGRPEAGSHPHPVNYGEIQIELYPELIFDKNTSKKQLVETLRTEMNKIPGINLNFTQPIQNSFDELISGIKSQLAIKIYGPDTNRLQSIAQEIHHKIENIKGLTDLSVEQSFGQPQVQVIADRKACARHGVSVDDLLEMVEYAIGGENIGEVFFNNRKFSINLRYQEKFRNDPESIGNMLISTSNNSLIQLRQIAEIKKVIGPIQINRENNQRRWVVQGNIKDRDIGSTHEDIKKAISGNITLPVGYSIEYGGQFENQQRAMFKLFIIVPIAIASVFILLWLSFASLKSALIIFMMVPLSMIGGVLGLIVMKLYLSVPASIGFIALFGMAMLDGMVMINCFNNLKEKGLSTEETINQGCEDRLPAILMTTVTTLLGLLPLLISNGIGSEVQRPLASVVVFGLMSSTTLSLFIIPALYNIVENYSSKS
ncbi:MAG: efflux RND transporter permease subunit [Candidatus Riflebacteria bacterium]|nr:efflux RND transporter permease subunit [Candidatus Riflebacteria bacterium]